MFLLLNHQKLDVYFIAKEFTAEYYKFSKHLPADERFAMVSQIRRAALSINLNIAEGCSRKSSIERKRFFEIARGSMIEIDAAFDVAEKLNYFIDYDHSNLNNSMLICFKLLSGLIRSS